MSAPRWTISVIQSLRVQQAQASAQLADLQSRYGDKYPDVIKARDALNEINAQIQQQIQRVLSSLTAASDVSHTRTASLEATAAQARGALAANNRALVRLNELQSNADAAKAIYDAFLVRYKETIAKEYVQTADGRVVTPAKLPTDPRSPNKKLGIWPLRSSSGWACSPASRRSAIAEASGQQGVSSPARRWRKPSTCLVDRRVADAGVNVQGTAAAALRSKAARLDPVDYVVAKPLSLFAEGFRNLRTVLAASRTGVKVKVIAVTSSLPGEGQDHDRRCASRGRWRCPARAVVLMDCDLRQRSITRMHSGLTRRRLVGGSQRTAPLDQALVKDNKTELMLLPLSKRAFTPRDVFGSPALEAAAR